MLIGREGEREYAVAVSTAYGALIKSVVAKCILDSLGAKWDELVVRLSVMLCPMNSRSA